MNPVERLSRILAQEEVKKELNPLIIIPTHYLPDGMSDEEFEEQWLNMPETPLLITEEGRVEEIKLHKRNK